MSHQHASTRRNTGPVRRATSHTNGPYARPPRPNPTSSTDETATEPGFLARVTQSLKSYIWGSSNETKQEEAAPKKVATPPKFDIHKAIRTGRVLTLENGDKQFVWQPQSVKKLSLTRSSDAVQDPDFFKPTAQKAKPGVQDKQGGGQVEDDNNRGAHPANADNIDISLSQSGGDKGKGPLVGNGNAKAQKHTQKHTSPPSNKKTRFALFTPGSYKDSQEDDTEETENGTEGESEEVKEESRTEDTLASTSTEKSPLPETESTASEIRPNHRGFLSQRPRKSEEGLSAIQMLERRLKEFKDYRIAHPNESVSAAFVDTLMAAIFEYDRLDKAGQAAFEEKWSKTLKSGQLPSSSTLPLFSPSTTNTGAGDTLVPLKDSESPKSKGNNGTIQPPLSARKIRYRKSGGFAAPDSDDGDDDDLSDEEESRTIKKVKTGTETAKPVAAPKPPPPAPSFSKPVPGNNFVFKAAASDASVRPPVGFGAPPDRSNGLSLFNTAPATSQPPVTTSSVVPASSTSAQAATSNSLFARPSSLGENAKEGTKGPSDPNEKYSTSYYDSLMTDFGINIIA